MPFHFEYVCLETSKYAFERTGDAANIAYDKADQTIRMATDRARDAKDAISGTVDYAKETMARAMGSRKNKAEYANPDAKETAEEAKDSIMYEAIDFGIEKASNAYDEAKRKINQASDMAFDAKEMMEVGMRYGKDKAGNAYDELKQKMMEMAESEEANDVKDMVSEAVRYGKDRAADAYNEARQKVEESYLSAKESGIASDKINYEVAKEKASKAAGDFGAKMRIGD